jgi:exonuclease III
MQPHDLHKSSHTFLSVAFNNVEKFGIAKQSQILHTLVAEDFDVFGVIETGFSNSNMLQVKHPGYEWLPKNRKDHNGGGLGMFVKSSISLTSSDTLDTQHDAFERMWITIRVSGTLMSICLVYYPNDNKDQPKSESLTNELTQNINSLLAKGYEILLLGDFNG